MTTEHLLTAFKKEYSHLKEIGFEIIGVVRHSGSAEGIEIEISIGVSCHSDKIIDPQNCHISVKHPFVIDHNTLPKKFMGFPIVAIIPDSSIPDEVKQVVYDEKGNETNWTPDQFVNYVIDNIHEIRKMLKSQTLLVEGALNAICYGDYQSYKKHFESKTLDAFFRQYNSSDTKVEDE